ncbi:AAA family ATPase [Altererythrobacter luteolus]|uniref:AAA family ATPase n=1 Tax=Pontixanthobacter luteolus TaxID=295089 RepID=A0A6I4V0T0_9SPHN|nr:AAA family ATPase [Pontixanthobacter luteolus]MXP47438.1 AAA family ATPase [Pontixanthobacter luteolus]
MTQFTSSPVGEAERFWQAFGFDTFVDPNSGSLIGTIPKNTVALVANGNEQVEAQRRSLQAIGIFPLLWANAGPLQKVVLYALHSSVPVSAIRKHFDGRSTVYGPDDPITLPSGDYFQPNDWVDSASALSVLDTLQEFGAEPDAAETESTNLPPIVENSPLAAFSLAGMGAELERHAKEHTGLLGGAILFGQSTVIYAPPNAGKTLIVLHLLSEGVDRKTIRAQNVYYINADDSGRGVAEKVVLLDELQANTLVPGMSGFTTSRLSEAIAEMVTSDQCNDVIVIIDTLKKFVDLMDKAKSAGFGNLVRQFTLKGGTFVALAHTRKNGSPDGQPIYGGTSDIVEDFDAACLLVPLEERTSRNEKIVQFQFTKRRGPNDDEAYSYDDAKDLSYAERLASVKSVDAVEFDKYSEADAQRSDQQIIEAIRACLTDGVEQKMAISREAAARSGASRRAIINVLERYTGDDPAKHLWNYSIRERGAKVFFAHDWSEPDDP